MVVIVVVVVVIVFVVATTIITKKKKASRPTFVLVFLCIFSLFFGFIRSAHEENDGWTDLTAREANNGGNGRQTIEGSTSAAYCCTATYAVPVFFSRTNFDGFVNYVWILYHILASTRYRTP